MGGTAKGGVCRLTLTEEDRQARDWLAKQTAALGCAMSIDDMGVTVFSRIEDAIQWADALNVLRLQLERMQAGYIPSLREYNRVFGISRERLERAPKDLLILHPGPMNRGVEIDSDVADGPHSVILNQVTNGVAVRMAVLYLLAGGKPELAEAAKGGGGR